MKIEFGGVCFLMGDVAAGVGAILAGCDFFAGYPITPASEIMEFMAEELPKRGGVFIQMEDEIGSIAAIIGASWAGRKAMTATSGPGYSLMQENIGYAYMTETPIVVINVQRAGPSTGQATMPAQGDVMQSRFGTHGDYESVVFAPNSPQEMLDLTIKAFNTAEMLRTPVTVLSDAEVGHMREKVVIPEKVKIVNRKRPKGSSENSLPFWSDEEDLVPSMPIFGEGYELLVTGSTHRGDGTRDVRNPETHEKLVKRLYEKIHRNKNKFMEWEELYTDDARILVISFGISSRPSKGAVIQARKEGLKVGFFRPKVLWPSPEERLLELAESVEKVLLVELSLRGYLMEIQRIFGVRNVVHYGTPRPEVPLSSQVLEVIRRVY